jgi:hypothetical protein
MRLECFPWLPFSTKNNLRRQSGVVNAHTDDGTFKFQLSKSKTTPTNINIAVQNDT